MSSASTCIAWGLQDWLDTQGVTSSALYWPVDEVGSQTPGRLRLGDLSQRYTSCFVRQALRSC
jgi:hypothetical protein